MSELKTDVNAIEIMYGDFHDQLWEQYIEKAKDILSETWKIDKPYQMEKLKEKLHEAYVLTESAYTLVSNLNVIDKMVNKKEETEEYREI